MKNKRLKLGEVKVQSFVTSINENDSLTVKGGQYDGTDNPICLSAVPACVNTHPNFCTNFPSAYDACPTQRGCTIV
jgi:uncharacterized protein YggL (DUF469 family)